MSFSDEIAAHLRAVIRDAQVQAEREERLRKINIRRKWRGKDPLYFRPSEPESEVLKMLSRRPKPLEGGYFFVRVDESGEMQIDAPVDD